MLYAGDYAISVRCIDSAYHVAAYIQDCEFTHNSPLTKNRAWNLARRITSHIDDGFDLNLEHWSVAIR